jgi:2-dehydro-3-deoxy-D-arabinonate dehydratase
LGLFRLRLADGSIRLARGDTGTGPAQLLPEYLTIADLLRKGSDAVLEAVTSSRHDQPLPKDAAIEAPVDSQEIWAAGVTYLRSRAARMDESAEPSVYDRVYDAPRPELFFKAPGWRVRGPGAPIAFRADSDWNVPEPELALVVTPALQIAAYSIGNDVSSRTIEGDNPLYLPQAKIYDGACAIGPCLVPVALANPPLEIRLKVLREGNAVVDQTTSTAQVHRDLGDLVEHLGRALTFPEGVVLLTGTGIVPDNSFTLRVGDLVQISIEQLGVLENHTERVGPDVQFTGNR